MQKRIIIKAPAKINLGLSVLKRRPDQFHDLETVMQQISLADTVVIEAGHSEKNSLYCTNPELARDDNLVCQAVRLLEKYSTKPLPRVTISLYKAIPVQAGLAGGSSDAAAALIGLNKFWQLGLNNRQLMKLGLELGSDIPYCIHGGTALAEGRGEIITPLPDLPFYWVVLALPSGLGLSTAAVFRSLSKAQDWPRPDQQSMVEAVKRHDRQEIDRWFKNCDTNTFEEVLSSEHPVINVLKNRFKEMGLHPALSGSGPTLFALAGNYRQACLVSNALYNDGARTFVSWVVSAKFGEPREETRHV